MKRIPEPELMEDPAQARAYAWADFAEVNQRFVDRFRTTFPNLGSSRCIDLGCGPADIPLRLARALPELSVVAVDGSMPMLELARAAIRDAGLSGRVHVVRARVSRLPLPPRTFDVVISNSLLHHLPDPAVFWTEAIRVARPAAALLVMDLFRPHSPQRAREIVEESARDEDPVLKLDFYNSLRAAFTPDEVRGQLARFLPRLDCVVASERHWLVSGRLP